MIEKGSQAPNFLLPGCGKSGHRVFDLKEAVESQNLLLIFCSNDILEEPMEHKPLEYAPWFKLLSDMKVWIVSDGGFSPDVNQANYPLNSVPILLDRHNIVANQYGVTSDDQTWSKSSMALVIIDESRTVKLASIYNSETISELKQVLLDTGLSGRRSNVRV